MATIPARLTRAAGRHVLMDGDNEREPEVNAAVADESEKLGKRSKRHAMRIPPYGAVVEPPCKRTPRHAVVNHSLKLRAVEHRPRLRPFVPERRLEHTAVEASMQHLKLRHRKRVLVPGFFVQNHLHTAPHTCSRHHSITENVSLPPVVPTSGCVYQCALLFSSINTAAPCGGACVCGATHRAHGALAHVLLQLLHHLQTTVVAQLNHPLVGHHAKVGVCFLQQRTHFRRPVSLDGVGVLGRVDAAEEGCECGHARAVVVGSENVRLCDIEHGEAHLQQYTWPVVEETVQNVHSTLKRHCTEVAGDEPRQRQHRKNPERVCARVYFWQLLSNQLLKYSLVNQGPNHLLVVVVGQHAVRHRRQQPKGILFGCVHQQHCGNDVHRLAVPDLVVVRRIREQHTAESVDAVVVLECRVLGQRAMQIPLNLIPHTVLHACAAVPHERRVVPGVGREVVERTRRDHPDLRTLAVRHPLHDEIAIPLRAEHGDAAAIRAKVQLPHVLFHRRHGNP
eukprot:m.1569691 g.1569691  ORF g.1569691 m.1569691 type:complete len:508 (-) comp25299_c0_seq33:1638-3161(-)